MIANKEKQIEKKVKDIRDRIEKFNYKFYAEWLAGYMYALENVIYTYIKKGYAIEFMPSMIGCVNTRKGYYIIEKAKPYKVDLHDSNCLDHIITNKDNQKLLIHVVIPESTPADDDNNNVLLVAALIDFTKAENKEE